MNITHTPYQGEGPAVTAAVGGHITGVLVNLFSTAPYIKAGRLRGLAVTSVQRDALVPDVPTARELGLPEIEATNWAGFVVHSGTPAAAVTRLNADIVRILNAPDVRDGMKQQGLIATPSTPEQFSAHIKAEIAKWAKVIKDANVELQ